MHANFKLIKNTLKCNPLNPFVQLIKFSNLNGKLLHEFLSSVAKCGGLVVKVVKSLARAAKYG